LTPNTLAKKPGAGRSRWTLIVSADGNVTVGLFAPFLFVYWFAYADA
jgi:hypothetical protein